MNLARAVRRFVSRFGYELVKTHKFDTISPAYNCYDTTMYQSEPLQAHMFWAYGNLSRLERLSAASFVANGFLLKIWTYGEIENLPLKAEQSDARKILPESRVFTYSNGSYAGFADLFRYALLNQVGGLWSDSDIICLNNSSALQSFLGIPVFW